MENKKVKAPGWFLVVAIVLVLWNIMGLFSFIAHTFISNEALEALPANERALYNSYPLWTVIVFAVAVITGLAASLAIILRKIWAKPAALLSLIAVIIQMTHNVIFTKSIEVYGLAQTLIMPIMVVVIALFMLWFSLFAIRRNWLD